MRPEDRQALKRIESSHARLISLGRGQTYVAYRNGDRRNRPLFYLEATQLKRLLATGYLVPIKGEQFGLRSGEPKQNYRPPNGAQRRSRARKHVLERLSRSRAGCRPYLTASEVRAGYRFTNDYARLESGAITGQNFSRAGRMPISASGPEISMANRVDIQAHITAALNVAGLDSARILTAVLGHDIDLETYEMDMNWQQGNAKHVLKTALSDLAAHYRRYSDTVL